MSKKKSKKTKEKRIVAAVMDEKTDIDFKTEAVPEEEPENQISNIVVAISEIVGLIDLTDRKHIVAAERLSGIEKSIAGITFFMDMILAIPEIRNNLPQHVREALDKKHENGQTKDGQIQEEKNEAGSIPLKERISFLKSEAENVTKKMR